MLYSERFDLMSDTVFWCGHQAGNGNITEGDKVIMMASGVIILTCRSCWIALCKTILESGVYLDGDGGPISFWCDHREFVGAVGQPAEGDLAMEIAKDKDAFIVGCANCADTMIEKIAEKAIRLKFENIETLEDMIRGD